MSKKASGLNAGNKLQARRADQRKKYKWYAKKNTWFKVKV